MARQFSVSTVFQALDRFTQPVLKFGQAMVNFGNQAHNQSTRVQQAFNRINQSSSRTSQAVNKLKSAFNFHNVIGHLNDVTRAIGRVGSAALSAFKPGWGTVGAIAAGGYTGLKLTQNSMEYEKKESQLTGVLMSQDRYQGQSDAQIEGRSKSILAKTKDFAASQVGEYADWAEIVTDSVARGFEPNERLMKAWGNLAAQHTGGMPGMIETWRSGARGETGALDQIKGLSANSEGGEVTLHFKGQNYNLGNKNDATYYSRYINAMQQIAEKAFGRLGELYGKTLDARWSTLVSTFETTFDEAFRGSGFFDTIKAQVDSLNEWFIQEATPIKSMFTGFFQNLEGKTGLINSVTNSIKGLISVGLKALNTALNTILSNDFGLADKIKDFFDKLPSRFEQFLNTVSKVDFQQIANNVRTFITQLFELGKAFIDLMPKLTQVISFVANPTMSIERMLAARQVEQEEKGETKSSYWAISGILPGVTHSGIEEQYKILNDERQGKKREQMETAKNAAMMKYEELYVAPKRKQEQQRQQVIQGVLPQVQSPVNDLIGRIYNPADPFKEAMFNKASVKTPDNKVQAQKTEKSNITVQPPKIDNVVNYTPPAVKVELTNNNTVNVSEGRQTIDTNATLNNAPPGSSVQSRAGKSTRGINYGGR